MTWVAAFLLTLRGRQRGGLTLELVGVPKASFGKLRWPAGRGVVGYDWYGFCWSVLKSFLCFVSFNSKDMKTPA